MLLSQTPLWRDLFREALNSNALIQSKGSAELCSWDRGDLTAFKGRQ